MAVPTILEDSVQEDIRARLDSLEGVERVLLDEPSTVWVVADAGREPDSLTTAAQRALQELGQEALRVEVVARPQALRRRRVRFDRVERTLDHEGRVRVQVFLEWEGEKYTGEAVGGPGGPMELRSAATAAIHALESVVGPELDLRLIGVKQMRAFDADFMVVSVDRRSVPGRQLVGTVLTSSDPLRAAAVAVLSAVNRVLGNYLLTGT